VVAQVVELEFKPQKGSLSLNCKKKKEKEKKERKKERKAPPILHLKMKSPLVNKAICVHNLDSIYTSL
jgi:hypothetical protein